MMQHRRLSVAIVTGILLLPSQSLCAQVTSISQSQYIDTGVEVYIPCNKCHWLRGANSVFSGYMLNCTCGSDRAELQYDCDSSDCTNCKSTSAITLGEVLSDHPLSAVNGTTPASIASCSTIFETTAYSPSCSELLSRTYEVPSCRMYKEAGTITTLACNSPGTVTYDSECKTTATSMQSSEECPNYSSCSARYEVVNKPTGQCDTLSHFNKDGEENTVENNNNKWRCITDSEQQCLRLHRAYQPAMSATNQQCGNGCAGWPAASFVLMVSVALLVIVMD